MISDYNFPYNVPALRIEQPLGVFYVASFPADLLLKVTYSTPATAVKHKESMLYNIFGAQRSEKEERLREIAKYIDTVESAFPNSIIIGANYTEDGVFVTEENQRWKVEPIDGDDFYRLIIPSQEKIASLIDGQHRLHAFEYADDKRRSMPLLCAVYLDIPLPYHAYIFATINFNQKKVDRSLAYELFGFNLEEGSSQTWAPETLAVYLVRMLNCEGDSPFYNHIRLGVQDEALREEKGEWLISMATIVDGILSLISSSPKRDRYMMHKKSVKRGRSRDDLKNYQDNSPLREEYIQGNDKGIYSLLHNYFEAAKDIFWNTASKRSFIKKTVGIQALFDILRILLTRLDNLQNLNRDYFLETLRVAGHVDFTDNFFQASGTGRGRIKNAIGICLGLIDIENLRVTAKDRGEYVRICKAV